MNPKTISDLYPPTEKGEREAIAYLNKEGLASIVDSIAEAQGSRIRPKYRDLARLHTITRERKAFNVVEYGVGFSTLIFADALMKNEADWEKNPNRPKTRETKPFQLYSVDGGDKWINATREILPAHLKDRVHFTTSTLSLGTFQDRLCHYYDQLPDVVSDFIYIDGPDPVTVEGKLGGQSWKSPNRPVMSADLLRIEPTLVPGTLVLLDGRTANARFLAHHLYRNWGISRGVETDVTVMELQELPLGSLNRGVLEYQLGDHVNAWPETIEG